jgi:hypothetical protein
MKSRARGRRRSSRSLLAAGVLAAGCGDAVPPPVTPTPPSPEGAASVIAAPPVAPSVAPPSTRPAAAAVPLAAAPLAEPLPRLTRPIVSVTVPGVEGPITSVHGRSSHDIWFLAGGDDFPGSLVHYEPPRARVVAHWTYEDYLKPAPVRPVVNKFMSVFSYGPHTPIFLGVYVDAEEVHLLGSVVAWARGPGLLRGALSKDGTWRWESSFWRGATFSSGDLLWKLDCDMEWRDCSFETSGALHVPLPSHDGSFGEQGARTPLAFGAMWMRGLDDGWMTITDDDGRPRLLRYNGVTWAPLAALDAELAVVSLWADAAGHAWIAARRGGKDEDPANVLLRFDGSALHALPVPASFAAFTVRGTGERDVWFVGAGRKVYQWDGQTLRQGEAPFGVGDAWASPDGEVWLASDGKAGKGVVARIPRPSEVR